MEPVMGPGIAPLDLVGPGERGPAADRDVEPTGFLVESEPAVRIHFLDWGAETAPAPRSSGTPAVLLVHGIAETAWTWAPVARRLRRWAHVVAVDLRGHGLSDAPTHGYDADGLAGDAIAVAEGAGLLAVDGEGAGAWGPFVVAGIGFGAIVGAWTAERLGRRCAGLVLVDGGWEELAADGATVDEWLAGMEEPPEVLASMSAWLADRASFDPSTWDADQERAARVQVVETAAGRVKLAVHPHAVRATVAAMLGYRPPEVLPAVAAPLVALMARDDEGRRHAALVDIARARVAAGRGPIRAAAFRDRGHNLARHEPDAVVAAIVAAVDPAGRSAAARGVAG